MDQAEQEKSIEELELRIERLRALYEQYFMGIEKLEPLVPRKDVDRRIYLLRREQIRNTGLRFRFQQMVSRYNTFGQYWQRILREIERGTYKRDLKRAARRFGVDANVLSSKAQLTAADIERLAAAAPSVGTQGSTTEASGHEAAAARGSGDRADDGSYELDENDLDDVDALLADDENDEDDTSPFRRTSEGIVAVVGRSPGPPAAPPAVVPSVAPPPAPAPSQPIDDLGAGPPSWRSVPRRVTTPAPSGPVSLDDDDDLLSPVSLPPPRPSAPTSPTALPPARPSVPVPITPTPSAATPLSGPPPSTPSPRPSPSMAPPRPSPSMAPPRPSPSMAPAPITGMPASSPSGSLRPPAPAPRPSASIPAPPPSNSVAPPRPSVSVAPPRPSGSIASPPPSATSALRPSASIPAPRPSAPAPASRPSGTPPGEGGLSDARIREIYSNYVEAKRKCNESTAALTIDSLTRSLRESAPKLREKHGGKNVDFDVVIKDGKAVLKPVLKG